MPDRYEDASILRNIRPQYARKGRKFDQWITAASAPWQREHIVQIRRYVGLEFPKYGMAMDVDDDCWQGVEVYPFCDELHYTTRNSELREAVIGAAGFQCDNGTWVLKFVWLHPFWRHQGLCRRAWPSFLERYGQFVIEPPISNQLQRLIDEMKSEKGS